MSTRATPNFLSTTLALLIHLLVVSSPATASDCRNAAILDAPPTSREWRTALGSDSTQIRILLRQQPDYMVAYQPQWHPTYLMALRDPSVAPFRAVREEKAALKVSWDDILRIDNRVSTGHPARGMVIGGAIGVAVPLLFAVTISASADDRALIALAFMPITVPLGIIVGGSVDSGHEWVPVLCTASTGDP